MIQFEQFDGVCDDFCDLFSAAIGEYILQDFRIRSCVLPLFEMNQMDLDSRPKGWGTAFRIDPWSICATAYHVIEPWIDVLGEGSYPASAKQRGLLALEEEEPSYGHSPILQDAWRTISGAFTYSFVEQRPLALPVARNFAEISRLEIRPSYFPSRVSPFLPMALEGARPSSGDKVIAVGFANLDQGSVGAGDNRPLQSHMIASVGNITEFREVDLKSGRPWPRFHVNRSWSGGMSGGPVFNADGNVIGIVSSGIEGDNISSAVAFHGWSVPTETFPSLDAQNPGWFKCWAALDSVGNVRNWGESEASMVEFANGESDIRVRRVNLNPRTLDVVSIS